MGVFRVDALDVIRLCVRRWYVFVPMVLLAASAGFGLSTTVKPEYTAYASYALVYRHGDAIKGDTADPRNSNPLAVNGGTLLGEALVADLNTDTSQQAFGGANRGWGPGDTANDKAFSVTLPQNAQSYVVQTWGASSDAVRTTVDQVLAALPGLASSVQNRAGAPEISQYTTFVTVPTQVTELPPQSKMKVLLPLIGVGIAAGVSLSLLAERWRIPGRKQPSKRRRPSPARLPVPPVAPVDNAKSSEPTPKEVTRPGRVSTGGPVSGGQDRVQPTHPSAPSRLTPRVTSTGRPDEASSDELTTAGPESPRLAGRR